MKDLISRHDAIDTLNVGAELLRRVLDADIVGVVERAKYEWGLELIESYISDMKELPSAQAEIIRCKDCKHWRERTSFSYCDKLHGMGVLDALDYMTAEDDYCSMAERREE